MRFLFLFILISNLTYSQKVTLTPLSFQKEFELKKAPTNNVLKDYTEFASTPFKKIPEGFTLSDASVFYKFDTLNCSLFIRKREDVDSLYYYRDCEDGKFCANEFRFEEYSFDKTKSKIENYKRFRNWQRGIEGCCDMLNSDTSALLFKNEFVDFQDFVSIDKNLPSSIVSVNLVSNKDYHEFVNYLVDSISRTRIAENNHEFYLNYDPKLYYENRLNYAVKFRRDDEKLQPILAELYYPHHEKYYWKKQLDTRKIVYNYSEVTPTSNYSNNVCNKCRQSLDDDLCGTIKKCNLNKLDFSYSNLLEFQKLSSDKIGAISDENSKIVAYSLSRKVYTIIYPDTLSWLYTSTDKNTSNYSIWASQNYFQKKEFENLPVQGVNYWQAKAFLAWKTNFHNQELIRQKLPYRVMYSFPLPEELVKVNANKIGLPEIDLNLYIITNKEYEDFVVAIADSIIVRMMGNFDPEKYLYPPYDDNGDERPISDWKIDKHWYKKYYGKSMKELKKLKEFKHFETLLIKIDSANIQYEGFDNRTFYYAFMWQYYDKDTLYRQRDLNLSYSNHTKDYSHVYSHSDRSNYIYREKVQIYPGYDKIGYSLSVGGKVWEKIYDNYKKCDSLGINRFTPDSLDPNQPEFWKANPQYFEEEDYSMPFKTYDFKSNPNAPITAITYEQAKAYYHWKNEVPYIPTNEEWNLIKQGINPYEEKELEVPGPFFRYVIRVYPVRESK